MVIAGVSTAENGGNIANLMFTLTLIFCGVLATAPSLPGFWIFMYRISPFTYLVSAMLSTALANTEVSCAPNEFVQFQSPPGMSCMEYMGNYTMLAGGYLQDESAQTDCSFCPIKDTNMFLQQVGSSYDDRWRNFGILIGFFVFFCTTYLFATEYIPAKKSKGEILVFRSGHAPKEIQAPRKADEEAGTPIGKAEFDQVVQEKADEAVGVIQRQTAIFHWEGEHLRRFS